MSSDMSPEDAARFATTGPAESAESLGESVGEQSRSSTGSSSTSSVWDMLMSSEPECSPSTVSGSFDTSAPWHKHFEAGLTKMTGSHGTPAIVHMAMGLAMLALEGLETPDDSGGDESTDDLLDQMSVGDV